MHGTDVFYDVVLKQQVDLISIILFQGHVIWDTVMPANLGYITAMLFNQNNCASEASTVTSKYELEVGQDLCEMVGFNPDTSMGHLVTGGTVANIEAMWAARNVKYYPIGLQDAIKNEEALSKARDYVLFLPHKNKELRIVDATTWDLFNMDVDEIVQLPGKVGIKYIMPDYLKKCILTITTVSTAVAQLLYSLYRPQSTALTT